jgi:hypothetical protein
MVVGKVKIGNNQTDIVIVSDNDRLNGKTAQLIKDSASVSRASTKTTKK